MEDISLILGFFDGVHIGHRHVIESAVQTGNKAVLLTFPTSPSEYFNKKTEYIFKRETSYEKIYNLGVDSIIETEFSKLAKISASDYLEEIIQTYSPKTISTGFNHTFGASRVGNPDFLENHQDKYGYKYLCTLPCRIDNQIISSTYIKNLLSSGEIEKANEALESPFTLESRVIIGAQLGRKLGFPTANMDYPDNIVRIPYGVYCVKTLNMPAILNWGIKPTIGGNKEVLEVHIPNFSEDLYGKTLRIEVLKKIRDEKKFNNLEELKLQIEKDIKCLKSL